MPPPLCHCEKPRRSAGRRGGSNSLHEIASSAWRTRNDNNGDAKANHTISSLPNIVLACLVLAASFASHANGQVVRGDSSQLPKIDYTKKFEGKNFDGYNREFKGGSVQFKDVDLPTFSGNLKALPMTEWKSDKPDLYKKNLELKDFEGKKITHFADKDPVQKQEVSLGGKQPSIDSSKAPRIPSTSAGEKQVPTPQSIGGQELKDLINKGITPEKVTVGKGITSRELHPVPAQPKVRVESEKSSPP
ncbi:MAG: hypothetical protein PHV34_19890 [Verrucomicrobiae bacterium]|nr:hypothetical protein [Verrucomicrobiae bacterium]